MTRKIFGLKSFLLNIFLVSTGQLSQQALELSFNGARYTPRTWGFQDVFNAFLFK